MKKRNLLYTALIIPVVLFLVSFSQGGGGYPGGAPAGYTGSPGDGKDCSDCHGGSSTTVSGWITSDIPVQGYTPGNTYTITATASGSGPKGFEVSPQNSSGTLLGSLTAGSNNHLTGGGKYVTQNGSINSNPASWMFQWTAPAAGTGTVTFYGAFAITTSATKLSTLVVNELVTVPLTVQATATPQVITVGDSTYLQAAADGGSGSYTYSWTSVPAGFSSGQQNVWAKPAVSTRYIVQVNDGIITALDSVDVTVNFPSGIVLNNGTSGFVLFPNPNHGTFKLVTERNEPVTVSVFDLSGRMAWRENFLPLSAGSALTIDISSLPKGIYFVEAVSGSRKSIQKMIIY